MAVHPLRPATYLRLGGPLPLQLANRTQGSPQASPFITKLCTLMTLSGIISSFLLLSQSRRQVPYALLTRPPWLPWCKHHFPIDLHVLSILSAFILSQDQTLHSTISFHLIFLSYYLSMLFPSFFLPLFYMSSIVLSTTPAVDKNYSIKFYFLCQQVFSIFLNFFSFYFLPQFFQHLKTQKFHCNY